MYFVDMIPSDTYRNTVCMFFCMLILLVFSLTEISYAKRGKRIPIRIRKAKELLILNKSQTLFFIAVLSLTICILPPFFLFGRTRISRSGLLKMKLIEVRQSLVFVMFPADEQVVFNQFVCC